MMKRCSACDQDKPLDEFGVRKIAPDGRRGQCRTCLNPRKNNDRARERAREHYWTNREANLAQQAQWRAANKAIIAAANVAYRAANRDRVTAQKREHYRLNRKRMLAVRRAYHAKNRDKLAAQSRVYYYEHRDELLQRNRVWRAANRAIILHNRYKARCKEYGFEPFGYVTEAELAAIIAEHGGLCAYCCKETACTIDHVIPVSRGGHHIPDNVLPACLFCNSSKGSKTLDEWVSAA